MILEQCKNKKGNSCEKYYNTNYSLNGRINIKNNGFSKIKQTHEAILSVLKENTFEILSAPIEDASSAILKSKKERNIDGIIVK